MHNKVNFMIINYLVFRKKVNNIFLKCFLSFYKLYNFI